MEKFNRLAAGIFLIVLINFFNNTAFAKEKTFTEYKSPNYSLEYVGNDRL